VVTPHWGPNKNPRPLPHVRSAADQLVAWGADLVAGHSAHVFHPAVGRVLFDLGDFLDDYPPDRALRNDLGLLFLVTMEPDRPVRTEAVPIAIDQCRTRLANGDEAAWIARRFRHLCRPYGVEADVVDGRLVVQGPRTG
jgi:poly-gamma-glutamate synthesis protein (capsule biosynthesis protein)